MPKKIHADSTAKNRAYRQRNRDKILARQRKHRADNPEWWREQYRRQYLRNRVSRIDQAIRYYHTNKAKVVARRLGVLEADVARVLTEKHCAICGKPGGKLSVDHDHATGQVRAMLCGPCNHAIGLFKERPAILRAAAEYLETFKLLG